jgi:hypothetical protein
MEACTLYTASSVGTWKTNTNFFNQTTISWAARALRPIGSATESRGLDESWSWLPKGITNEVWLSPPRLSSYSSNLSVTLNKYSLTWACLQLGFITCSQGYFDHICLGSTWLAYFGLDSSLIFKVKNMVLFNLILDYLITSKWNGLCPRVLTLWMMMMMISSEQMYRCLPSLWFDKDIFGIDKKKIEIW